MSAGDELASIMAAHPPQALAPEQVQRQPEAPDLPWRGMVLGGAAEEQQQQQQREGAGRRLHIGRTVKPGTGDPHMTPT